MTRLYEEFRFTVSDGLRLYGRKYGWENHDPVPLVCLAGLTRHSEDFDSLATHLSTKAGGLRRVLTLDYRGRGQSDHDRNWHNYNIVTEAGDAVAGMIAAGLEHVNLIGTSRGGLIAMVLAAIRPGILNSVILNDIGPELDGPGVMRIKRSLEGARAPASFAEAASILQRIYNKQFPKMSAQEWEEQARIIYKEKNEKLVTRYDPKLLNTVKSINPDVPLPTMWPQFRGLTKIPLLLVHGRLSDLINRDIVEKMNRVHPQMHSIEMEDEGHAPMLRDRASQKAIAQFLRTVSR